jgi:hypothetical protein
MASCSFRPENRQKRETCYLAGMVRGFTVPQSALLKTAVESCVQVITRGVLRPGLVLAEK